MLEIYDSTSSYKCFENNLKYSAKINMKSKAFKVVSGKTFILFCCMPNHWVLFSFWVENYSTVGCGITSKQKIESKSCLWTWHVRNKNRYTHIYWHILAIRRTLLKHTHIWRQMLTLEQRREIKLQHVITQKVVHQRM